MGGERPIAIISVGRYKSNRKVGGDSRVSVRREYQGRGLGKRLILCGFHRLKDKGIDFGEAMICIKRRSSIFAHLYCGFTPQTDLRKCQHRDHAFFLNRMAANIALRRSYDYYRTKGLRSYSEPSAK